MMRTRKVPPQNKALVPPPPRKKSRAPRVRLTHLEIRRGETLRLRIAVADDALADVGDELGALIKRIAPSTQTTVVQTTVVQPSPEPVPVTAETITAPDFIVTRSHVEHDDAYHAELREHLVGLFSALCDTGLEAALDAARNERDRRAEGSN
jgi:hypothetical protein